MIELMLAVMLAGAAAEDLVLIGVNTDGDKEYLDIASLKQGAEGRIATRRVIWATARASDGAKEVRTETWFKCDTQELRETTKTFHKPDGSIVETAQSGVSRWIWVGSSESRKKLLETACAKKLK